MTLPAHEVNFDALVGPTHNYAGLSIGNIASQKHGGATSNPKQAALEGLLKMKQLVDLGLKQAVLPPHDRPDVNTLRRLGFDGDDETVLAKAHQHSPALLATVCSASSMWAANAATVSPSSDTRDKRVHFTPANLISGPHRSIEASTTAKILKTIFNDESVFAHHGPLPATPVYGDEGAANHTRLCSAYHEPGIELFVYCKTTLDPTLSMPQKYPARQTQEASRAVARLHGLDPERTILIQQHPDTIDAGVFHNDVIAVGNRNAFLYHSDAYLDTPRVIAQLRRQYEAVCPSASDLVCIEVTPDQLSVADAVKTYLFNSQLVTLPDDTMSLICPTDCQQHTQAKDLLDHIVASDNPIQSVQYVDIRQSMSNGGGPACLRLRVVLTEDQMQRTHAGVFLTDRLYDKLTAWVDRHYRDHLTPDDLPDPKLLEESRKALDELTQILAMGLLYPFQ